MKSPAYYISRIKSFIFRTILNVLSFIIPKKKNLLFYVSIHDPNKFAGNLKFLYLYANANEPKFKSVFFARNQKVYNEVNELGFPVVKGAHNLLWYTLRAQHIIIDATTGFMSFKGISLIQLWHGAGIKNVGMANKNIDNYTRKIYQLHFDRYRFVTAISDYDKQMHNVKFNIKSAIVTGLARNDAFFQDQAVTDRIKKKYALESYSKIITYAPTFRDHFTQDNFSQDFWRTFNDYLKIRNQVFIIKKHPWDEFFIVPDNLSNVFDLTKSVEDVQELLIVTDLLISDYSSIVTDFSITKRPIIYYMFDHQLYLEKCRSMFDNIEDALPGPFVYHENELLQYIDDLSWTNDPRQSELINKFMNKFHKYFDGNSSKRIFEEIKRQR